MLTPLRRAATVLAAAAITLGSGAAAAFAFQSGNNPGSTGPNTITWTGQGATNGQLDSPQCDAANDPNGANQPYLLWVLTTDGGSIQLDDTTPVLHLAVNGNPQGDFTQSAPSSSNSVHFVTPYFTPDNTLSASADMNVLTTGNGAWNLVISHGCAGPAQARAPTVSKDAAGAYTTTWTWGIKKLVNGPTTIDTAPGNSATFSYEVDVTHIPSNGDITVAGTIDVNNPNQTGVSVGNIVDQLSDGVNCQITGGAPQQLAPGDNKLPYTCSIDPSQFDPSQALTNTVTVSWADQMLSDGSHLAAGQATFTTPTIQFTQNLVNDCADVTDSVQGDLGQVCANDPSPKVFTYQVTYNTQANPDPPGTCTKHDNTAAFTTNGPDASTPPVTGSDSQEIQVCVGQDLQVSKDATPSFTRTYQWNINKAVNGPSTIDTSGPATANYTVSVSHDAGTDSDWQVTGKVHVTNPNNWEDITLAGSQGLVDSIDNGGSCTFDNGDPSGTVIKAGATMDFPYTCTYSQAPSQSAFTNTATASWDANAADTADSSAQGTASGDFSNVSPKIVDGSVSVDDSLGGHLGTADYTQQNPVNFTYSVNFNNDKAGTCTDHPNTATFTTSDTGATGGASADVQVCVGADLQVQKNASASFNRTYNWDIAKAADKTVIDPGGKVTYTVTVNQDPQNPFSDSGWQVNGTITVANPNDWESVTLGQLSDVIDNGGTCTIAGSPGGTVIPASGQATFSYTCTFSSKPASSSGVNQAIAEWDSGAAYTPDSAAAGSAGYAFNNPANLTNQTIHVTDSQGGALGTVGPASDDPSNLVSATFTYSKTFSPPSSGCATVNNTATITETGQTASKSVQNCNSGALTMGFWHNQNGQAIIKGANQTALANYLTGYAPFADLSGSVANYFTNVFNAANAGGATANAQLKAQMLATALDVYFSDPALGGSKISAPAPIGGLTVNVSSWSAAFGGAASMTVNQMLSYAASQSNPGGSVWYGNVKSVQVVAIAAFGAVNNQQVTGA